MNSRNMLHRNNDACIHNHIKSDIYFLFEPIAVFDHLGLQTIAIPYLILHTFLVMLSAKGSEINLLRKQSIIVFLKHKSSVCSYNKTHKK